MPAPAMLSTAPANTTCVTSLRCTSLARSPSIARGGRRAALLIALALGQAFGATFYVAPDGDDAAAGSVERPVATLAEAQRRVRASGALCHERVDVILRAGVYSLTQPLVFTAEDSGTLNAPVVYRAAEGETVHLRGSQRLALTWQPTRDGLMVAETPAGVVIDQLFVNGTPLHLARYPNFDAKVAHLNGHAADAFAPARVKRWASPKGAYLHTLDQNLWGDFHYLVTGRNADGTLVYEGGWQTNRPARMHPEYRYVENVFEELDAPNEWFHDREAHRLYVYPAPGTRLSDAILESVTLRQLVEFRGEPGRPVRFVTLERLAFEHAARTFMDTKEPLLRSDWTICRAGALFFSGAEDCTVVRCELSELGGNGIFVSGYNRRIRIKECVLDHIGASGVAFVGLPSAVRSPLFDYGQHQSYRDLDREPGPKTDDYPAECTVEDCIIRHSGQGEKQSAGVQIAMSRRIVVAFCSIYAMPRAGINIGDGCWGGHRIEGCDVFDTVRETGDHGSFNAWGRDRYWRLNDVPPDLLPELSRLDAVETTVIRNSRWRCDNGWDIDLDDGASNYEIYNNVLLRGGLKLREGFFRRAHNNVIVNSTLYPHVWFAHSGDVFTHNIVMGRYRPAFMKNVPWGERIDQNFFASNERDRTAFVAENCDAHSLAGDARFVDAAAGDFRVKSDSAALRVGFANFPMNQFGVRPAVLRALASTPEIPRLRVLDDITAEAMYVWQGATMRALTAGEFSAVGAPIGQGGVLLTEVPPQKSAGKAGFQSGDLIEAVGGFAVKSVPELARALAKAPSDQPLEVKIRREQAERSLTLYPPFGLPEKTLGDGDR